MRDEQREELGRLVRSTWVRWAAEQPNPRAHHLEPWEQLPEDLKEVDRRIGEEIAWAVAGPAAVAWLIYGVPAREEGERQLRWSWVLEAFDSLVERFRHDMKLPPVEGQPNHKIGG